MTKTRGTTGFVWHERFMWHDTGNAAGVLPTRGILQPGVHFEHPETKRRLKNLLDGYGITPTLLPLTPEPVEADVLLNFHTADYVARIRAMSEVMGGDAGETAPVGPGSFDIALAAVGGCIAAAQAVIAGQVRNAYVLARPPGHHAERDRGRGFCIFANVALTALEVLARKRVERVAVVDWDVHHGNGTEQALYDRGDALTISIHQDRLYPPETGSMADTGAGAGRGCNINVPLPPGCGGGAYLAAMDRIVVPALERFKPDLILVACGFDASYFDPLGHMMLLSNHYASLMTMLLDVADQVCAGRVVVSHEGGYSTSYVPFCGVATIDVMRGERSDVRDPFADPGDVGWQALQPHQAQVIDEVVDGPLALLASR